MTTKTNIPWIVTTDMAPIGYVLQALGMDQAARDFAGCKSVSLLDCQLTALSATFAANPGDLADLGTKLVGPLARKVAGEIARTEQLAHSRNQMKHALINRA